MINKEDIQNLAKLSKLFIEGSEIDRLSEEMSSIINFANEISKINTDDINFDNINNLSDVFREDVIEESFDRQLILKNANGGKNGFFYLKHHKR